MPTNKITFILAGGVLLAGVVWLGIENRQLREQLEVAMSYQTQLQASSESNAQQRLQFEGQIAALNRQLASSALQLSNLSATLQEARLAVDPNYETLLQQARDEVAAQSRQQAGTAGRSPFSAFSDPANALAMANESMPRMYENYINALGVPGTERQQVMAALLDFGAQRYQMLGDLLAGSLTPEQASYLYGANSLADGMAASLSIEQQDDLLQYDRLLKQDTLREVYQQALSRTGSAIEGMIQDQVMQALMDELVSEENNWGAIVDEDGSMLNAHSDKVAAFDRARERLAPSLDSEQLAQLERFIDAESDGVDVILEASSDNSGRVAITHARIGVEDLPQ